jgi:hypothetical protein
MSFLSDIVDVGKAVFGGDSLGSSLARTAALGATLYLLNKNTGSGSGGGAGSSPTPDPRNRITLTPSTNNPIPVVYGSAFVGGIVTDAQISNENKTMHFVYTICEKTGTLLSDSSASEFTFEDVYINDQRLVFKEDGITVNYSVDKDSNVDYSMQNLVKVYCYAGNSGSPVSIEGYESVGLPNAYSLVPTWTSNHLMSDLIFAVVEVNYNADKSVTQAPSSVKFHISNTMTMPGDCLYDYMTNERYGAGIAVEEINV